MISGNGNAMSDEEFIKFLRNRYDELDLLGASINRFIAEAVKETELRTAHQIVDGFKRGLAALPR